MKVKFLIACPLLFVLAQAMAQSPVPDSDSIKDPIKQGDPTPTVIQPQASYRKSLVTIKSSQVPGPVRKKLEHSAYKGWEKATIYRNQTSTIYLIEFQGSGRPRTYRFDKNGQQLDVDDE